MKKLILIAVLDIFIVSFISAATIKVCNRSKYSRKAELVSVQLPEKFRAAYPDGFMIKTPNGIEVPYQIIEEKNQVQRIIFPVDIEPQTTVNYILTAGTPAKVKTRTFCRFVPERRDDFAWENDLCAYRMYGPALAADNPGNGVDMWLKSTADTVINKRYRNELQYGISYHVDHGEGLDCYGVGHSLGAGGVAPFKNGKLYVGNHYDRFLVHYTGPLQSKFTLYYDSVKVDNDVYKVELTITTSAGTLLNKAEVKYTGVKPDFTLAAGISLHDRKGKQYIKENEGIMAYAEEAESVYKVPAGRSYVGVVLPVRKTMHQTHNNHLLLISPLNASKTLVYYFGSGWNKWGFPTDNDWFNAVTAFKTTVMDKPLSVKIL